MAHLQFGLQALMTTILACGVWLALLRLEPQVTLFLSGAAASVHFTTRLVGIVRRVRVHGISLSDRMVLPALVLAALLSWAFLYILSLGPAIVIHEHWEQTREILEIIYVPVIWLNHVDLLSEPIVWYAEFWDSPISVRSGSVFVLGFLGLTAWGLRPRLKRLSRLKPPTDGMRVSFRELVPLLIRSESRRIVFAIIGVLLAGGGALAILIGLVWLAKGLSGADEFLAKGLGASAVGLASLWLAFHPRSPPRNNSEP